MSNVQLTAERVPCDLDHFVYSTGIIGRLKVLSTVPVVAGDSFELDTVGAFRLSPLRRGLSVDTNVDIFTFYVPYRHVYGTEFVDLMKQGIPATGTPPVLSTDDTTTDDTVVIGEERVSFLGTNMNIAINKVPKYLWGSYLRIYNHYFKNPYSPDVTATLASLPGSVLRDGYNISNLEALWTKPLNFNTQQSQKYADMPGNDGIDIMGLNLAYGKLHTQQEREHFMQRYRDVITSFGGRTHYDADQRPHLVMRSNFWASGYDVDGTSQASLGCFSGRTQQPFSHHVPRFYVPEHGVMMTLIVARFPPTHEKEMHPFVGKAILDYNDLACDPALLGNMPPQDIPFNYIFHGSVGVSGDQLIRAPAGQFYRFHPSHVDYRYRKLQGFPFYRTVPENILAATVVNTQDYDQCFQTTQLGHWNVQSKFNCTVMRHIPTARDSIMTS